MSARRAQVARISSGAGAIADENEGVSRRAILIMGAVIIGTSANQIAWNIVGVALPRMQGAYSASPDQISWVMSAFVLGNTLMFACVGWLAARFGRRRVFLNSIAAFTLTTIGCAFAGALEQQVCWRFLQGAASAALIPLGHAIATDAYPRQRFGEATVIWSIGLVASGAAAPLMGAYLIDGFGWSSVFFFTIPLGVISFAAAWALVPETTLDETRRMDWIGLAGALICVAALQSLLSRGNRLDWFDAPEIIVASALALGGFYICAIQTFLSRQPFVAPALFRDRNFVLGIVFAFLHGGLVMLSLVILPLLLEGLLGYTVRDVGELILPRGVGVICGMVLIGRLSDRMDARVLLALGYLGLACTNYMMSNWNLDVSRADVMLANFVLGVSGGIAFVPITKLAFSTLPKAHESEGFSFFYLWYYTGVASGVAGMLAVVARSAQASYAELAQHVTPYNKLFSFEGPRALWSRDSATGLAGLAEEISRQANMIAYNNGFMLAMYCALCAVPMVLLFKTGGERDGRQKEDCAVHEIRSANSDKTSS